MPVYGKCNAMVRWNNWFSRVFHICADVRQGGILSPQLFAVYIDGVIRKLELSGCGCRLHGLFVGCILYDDDIILLAQTVSDLQKMFDICNDEISALDFYISTYPSRFVMRRVGPRWNKPCAAFDLELSSLKFTDSTKYLGIYITFGRMFSCSVL